MIVLEIILFFDLVQHSVNQFIQSFILFFFLLQIVFDDSVDELKDIDFLGMLDKLIFE